MARLQAVEQGWQTGEDGGGQQCLTVGGKEVDECREKEAGSLLLGRHAQQTGVQNDNVVFTEMSAKPRRKSAINILLETITNELALKAKLPDDKQNVVEKLQSYTTRQTAVSSATDATTTVKGRFAIVARPCC